MKHKALYIATIIFFFLVNTTYYWEGKMGMYAMGTFLLLVLYFVVLTALLLAQTFIALSEKLVDKQRLFLIGTMIVVLGLSFVYPHGLISFDKFERDSLLIAQREGAANCMTTLKLKSDGTFIERNVCFGVTETTGTYKIKGDTIFFEKVSLGRNESNYYKFAVIKNQESKSEFSFGDIVRYEDYSDTTGIPLWIIKSELTK